MDLRFGTAAPTGAERAAVDAVLGAPATGWDGGEREAGRDGRLAIGGLAAAARRDLLLPALQALQERAGWISPGGLDYVCRRLSVPPAEAWGVATFYHLLATAPTPPVVVHVCDDLACRLAGAERLCARLAETIGAAGTATADGRATWKRSPCLGQCERAPAALLLAAGDTPLGRVLTRVEDASRIVDALSAAAAAGLRPAGAPGGAGAGAAPGEARPTAGGDAQRPGAGPGPSSTDRLSSLSLAEVSLHLSLEEEADVARSVPQVGSLHLRLLRRVGVVDPNSLAAFRAADGYVALHRAIELGRREVIDEIIASKLLGRGGAAFPTGRKWEAVANASPAGGPKFLVCNADESEPGTFKDRVLLEHDPFAILEAMTIAAFACGCERGFLYLRGEYPLAHRRFGSAIAQARAAGLLGADVAGAGFRFDVEIRRGGGAYICGEETALFNSIEGRRGEPRSKPPFPTEAGLFGRPTVVNNVETLANVPWIVVNGSGEYVRLGTPSSTGTKLFCVSGQVAKPGLYEVPFETTLGELLSLAGGMAGEHALRAVLLGGAAGAFVGPEAIGLPLTFEATRAAGVSLGSGVVLVFDESADLGDALLRIASFFRHESCGQCVPCRVGTVRQEELLQRLHDRKPIGSHEQELDLLRELAQAMRDASICGLGQTASAAIESALARLDPFSR